MDCHTDDWGGDRSAHYGGAVLARIHASVFRKQVQVLRKNTTGRVRLVLLPGCGWIVRPGAPLVYQRFRLCLDLQLADIQDQKHLGLRGGSWTDQPAAVGLYPAL